MAEYRTSKAVSAQMTECLESGSRDGRPNVPEWIKSDRQPPDDAEQASAMDIVERPDEHGLPLAVSISCPVLRLDPETPLRNNKVANSTDA
jgi:hypothetical protein